MNDFIFISSLFFRLVTNISDYDGDLSYMDDDMEDEITFTNSNQNRTSVTSMSEDRRSISTLNQQNFDNFEEIIKDEDGEFHFKDQMLELN